MGPSLRERLEKYAATPFGVIPATPGFMPADARAVLALLAAAGTARQAIAALQDNLDGSLISPARLELGTAMAAFEEGR